jgi:hypothetical protein
VALVAAIAALVSPPEAAAVDGTPYDHLVAGTASQEEADALLGELDERYRPGATAGSSRWEELLLGTGLTAAQIKTLRTYLLRGGTKAKWLPKVGVVASRVSIPLTAAWVGYTVYREFADGSDSDTLDLWIDSATLGQDALYNLATLPTAGNAHWYQDGVYWGRQIGGCPTGTSVCYRLVLTVSTNWGAGPHEFGTDYLADSAMLQFDNLDPPENALHSSYGWASFSERCDVGDDCPDQTWRPSSSISYSAGREVLYAIDATILNLVSDHPTMTMYVNGEDSLGYDTRGVYLTEGELTDELSGGSVTAPDSGDTYDDGDLEYTVPTNAGTTIGQAKDVAQSGSGPCWEAFVNWTVSPSTYPWSSTCFATGVDDEPIPEPGTGGGGGGGPTTLELPQMTDWTSHFDYYEALRAAGFTGTVHFNESCEDPWDNVGAGTVRGVFLGPDDCAEGDYGYWWGGASDTFGLSYWYDSVDLVERDAPPVSAPSDVEIWIQRESGSFDDPDGSAVPVGTIAIPTPDADETFAAYVARLRAAGFLGTITVNNTWTECTACLSGPAGAVQGVESNTTVSAFDSEVFLPGQWLWIGTGVETWTEGAFDQGWYRVSDEGAPWPDSSGYAQESATVVVTRNPGDEANESGLDLGPITPAECEPWATATLDLTPLTELDLGEKFPFGVFGWADAFLDLLTTEPVAPGWSFALPDLAGEEMPDFSFDLDAFSGYMSTIRTILAWVLWIGAVWYIATSFLGIRGAGDPGGAVEDAF